MRLAVLSSEFPPGPGGIGTHAYQLVSQLESEGWPVSVMTAQDFATKAEIASFNGTLRFPLVRLASRWGAPLVATQRWLACSPWIKSWKPDLLVATGGRSVWLAARLARRHGLPWVAIGHGTEFGATSAWERWLTVDAFSRASAVICVSEYTREQMLALGVQPRTVRVIPNGADHRALHPLPDAEVAEFRRSLGCGDGPLLLTVGQVTDRKGQEVVIRALPHVLAQAPGAHYLLAGLPTIRERLARIARELGVEDRVHFLGRVEPEKLLRLLNACDVFVMTSRRTAEGDFEGFGIAVVEAALCGKPAVVAAGSGLAEAIAEGTTGLLVPEGDAAATAAAILALLNDPLRLQAMGSAARRRALAEQTWAMRAHQYAEFFEELLGSSRTAHAAAVLARSGP